MGSDGTLLRQLLLVGAAVGALYAFTCWAWPYRVCRRCGGGGKIKSPLGGSFGYCRRCGGKGGNLRVGRRIWTLFRH